MNVGAHLEISVLEPFILFHFLSKIFIMRCRSIFHPFLYSFCKLVTVQVHAKDLRRGGEEQQRTFYDR